MRVLVTRPRADSERLAARLAGYGIDCVTAPILEIVWRADNALEPALAEAQAVLLTSANGARALAANTDDRSTTVITVGDATAKAARDLGFIDVYSVDGNAAALTNSTAARLDPAAGPLVHVSGRHVAGDPGAALAQADFVCRRFTLYEAAAVKTLPYPAAAALRDDAVDGALLFSARSARLLMQLVRAAGMEDRLARLTAWCLSDAVRCAANPTFWRRALAAPRPRTDSLCKLLLDRG